jgi:hypothetical protein
MKRRALILIGGAVLLAGLGAWAAEEEPLLAVSFARGAWDPAAWTVAKNPTVAHFGQWVQREQNIENATSTDPAKLSALEESLTTMVYTKPFSGDYTVAATFEIGAGSAPGIVIAQNWAPDEAGRPQYGEFYEVIIYEKGLNLWHHFARDGKRLYEKTAYSTFALKPDTQYKLEVRKQGKTLQMTVDGREVGVLVPSLPEELFLGVEGCEGVSRVYDFTVRR